MKDMKFTKSFILFLSMVLLAAPSYATTIVSVTSWDSSGEGAYVFYKKDGSDTDRVFSSEISHSKSGEQRIYFSIDNNFRTSINEYANSYSPLYSLNLRSTSKPISKTMVFDGQAVKMSGFSKVYGDTKNSYYSYTPETSKGHAYLINLFKQATSPIKVEFDGETIYLPVKGFTKKWNTTGGDAI